MSAMVTTAKTAAVPVTGCRFGGERIRCGLPRCVAIPNTDQKRWQRGMRRCCQKSDLKQDLVDVSDALEVIVH